jgi:CHAD domain-containing protein
VPPALLLRESPQQNFLLDLLDMIETLNHAAEPGAEPAPLRRLLRRRLQRWHARACADATGFAELDDEGRHRLRKRLKRLRYGIEFSAGLFDAERLRQGLKPLKQAQQVLGELNDLALALQACQAQLTQGPQAWFALAWFSARRDLLKQQALPMLQAFAAAPVAWKG